MFFFVFLVISHSLVENAINVRSSYDRYVTSFKLVIKWSELVKNINMSISWKKHFYHQIVMTNNSYIFHNDFRGYIEMLTKPCTKHNLTVTKKTRK